MAIDEQTLAEAKQVQAKQEQDKKARAAKRSEKAMPDREGKPASPSCRAESLPEQVPVETRPLGQAQANNAATTQPQQKPTFKLESFDDIMQDEPEIELIEGVLPSLGVVGLSGLSGLGKTFIALDMAIRIAAGLPWHGRLVQKRPVVYFYLEAGGGLKKRLKVWDIENPLQFPKDNIRFIRLNSIDLVEIWKKIPSSIPKDTVIFIDTLHKASGHREENSNTEMGLVMKAAGDLAFKLKSLVVFVHHVGSNDKKKWRGAYCVYDDADGFLFASEKNKKKYVEVLKNKDEEHGDKFGYYLKVVDTGEVKPSGKPITSCVPVSDSIADTDQDEPTAKAGNGLRSESHIYAYHAICSLLEENNNEPVSRSLWREKYRKINPLEPKDLKNGCTEKEKEAYRRNFNNAVAALIEKRLVKPIDGDFFLKT